MAFCYGVIAPVVATVFREISGASAVIPAFSPTVGQLVAFGLIVGYAWFSGWYITRILGKIQDVAKNARAEARETKDLLAQLDEQSVRAKQEGDRLATLLTEHLPSSAFVTTAKPKAEAIERKRIPDGEFEVSPQSKGGGLYIKVANWKADHKTGYDMCVVRMLWYSPDLDGKGGFLNWPWFETAPGPKFLPRTTKQRELIHGFPQSFELIPPATSDGWRFNLASGNATVLKKPRWRFVLELQWNDNFHPMLADVNLRTENGEKIADLSFFQGDDALVRTASG
jgi:hypothetical protein